jgi:hypothetical protein
MKKYILRFLICIVLFNGLPIDLLAQKLPDSIRLRVVLIRHGEKPPKGFNLSCRGFNRSLELPKVITSLFGIPDFIYVPTLKSGNTINSVRMYQTVVPLAVKYNLNVNTIHDQLDTAGVVDDIKKKSGTILLVWDLRNILPIVRNFGIDTKNLKWHESDFDSVWIIDFLKSNGEILIPKLSMTKENINPSPRCQ